MSRERLAAARALSWALLGLMVVASTAGLLVDGIYRDEAWILAAWRGNDLVTLFVAAPLLALGLVLAGRGRASGRLLWYAHLGYGVYNYAYYLFGAKLNPLFPVHVALLVASLLALILALADADVDGTAAAIRGRAPARPVAVYMALTGAGLLIAWLGQWAVFMLTGAAPAIGEDAFRLVAALDLSLMCPFFLIGAALLWRRRPWGYVLGAMMCLKGATYTLVLTAGSWFGARAGIPGAAEQVPIWGLWTAAGAAAAAALLVGVGPRGRDRG